MWRVFSGPVWFFATACFTESSVALPTGFCPTITAGATSQRPTQGAGMTRTSLPKESFWRSAWAPASSQEMESHTRTVSLGGGLISPFGPSFTTSKWW